MKYYHWLILAAFLPLCIVWAAPPPIGTVTGPPPHNTLNGRSATNAHPMSAVTGLDARFERLSGAIGTGGGVTVHDNLTGRDSADQHPMSAITGLEAAFENLTGSGITQSAADDRYVQLSYTSAGNGRPTADEVAAGYVWKSVFDGYTSTGRAPSGGAYLTGITRIGANNGNYSGKGLLRIGGAGEKDGGKGANLRNDGHPNWTAIQSSIGYNPTEFIIYSESAASGTATANGTTTVTLTSGSTNAAWVGNTFWFKGEPYTVASITDSTHVVLTGTVPTSTEDTWHYIRTTGSGTCNVSGTTVSRVAGEPFHWLGEDTGGYLEYSYIINGSPVTPTGVSDQNDTMTIAENLGTLTGVTYSYGININDYAITTLRVQKLQGTDEENFNVVSRPWGYYLEAGYAGSGQLRPVFMTSGVNGDGVVQEVAEVGATDNTIYFGGTNMDGDYSVAVPWTTGQVNHLEIKGATTTNPPTITAQGTDTNVSINLVTKGSGTVNINGTPISGGGGGTFVTSGSDSYTTGNVSINTSDIRYPLEISQGSATIETGIHISMNSTDDGGYINSTGAANLSLFGGATHIGGAITAKATNVSRLLLGSPNLTFYNQRGTTPGSTYTLTKAFEVADQNPGTLVSIFSPAGSYKGIGFYDRTTSTQRWSFGAETTAESGSNAGSNFVINSFDDSGNFIVSPITLTRATGNATFSGQVESLSGGFKLPDDTIIDGAEDLGGAPTVKVIAPAGTIAAGDTHVLLTGTAATTITRLTDYPATNGFSVYVYNGNSNTQTIAPLSAGQKMNYVTDGSYSIPSGKGAHFTYIDDATYESWYVIEDGAGGQWTTTGSDIYYTTGKVGIGTTTPQQPIDTYSTTSAVNMIRREADSASGGGLLYLYHNRLKSGSDFVLPSANDRLGVILFGAFSGTEASATQRNGAAILGYAEDTYVGGTDHSTNIRFETTPVDSATRAERVRIKGSGVVRFVPIATPASCELGDTYVNSSDNKMYSCTTAGTPGTWTAHW